MNFRKSPKKILMLVCLAITFIAAVCTIDSSSKLYAYIAIGSLVIGLILAAIPSKPDSNGSD